MKLLFNHMMAFLACLFAPVKTMANALDHRAMLLKLLGCDDTADEAMVNERYAAAMKADPDGEAKRLADAEKEKKAANEAKTAAETLVANEKTARTTAETLAATEKARADKAATDLTAANTSFANERKERVKLLLDAAVTGGKITGAQRTAYEAEFANVATFDATLAKLQAEKGTKLPGQRQAGMANIGERRFLATPEDGQRRDKIAQMVNEEMAKPAYSQLTSDMKYSRAFTAVMAAHPELAESKG